MADPNSHLAQFHALLWRDVPEQPCWTCHPEHRGADASLTDIAVTDFPHEATGFSLAAHRRTSAGAPFACADCHANNLTAFGVETCDACHAELAPARMAAHREDFGGQCLGCHDGIDRFSAFDHDLAAFPLAGAHAAASCSRCHTAAATADFTRAPLDCVGCHRDDDAHLGGLGADCVTCHTTERWEDATFDHSRTLFPLEGEHAQVECAECHRGGRFEGTPAACVDCHEQDDAHSGQLGRDCARCHAPDEWKNATFDHAQTAFSLEGKHAGAACAQCHADNRFGGTPAQCVECHRADDAHQGQYGVDCGGCHTPDDWNNATFDHAQTAFPLTGAHQQVRCEQCHAGGRFRGTPSACSGCHQEPAFHRGLFAQGCESCHTTAAWQPARFDLAHSFPIDHGERGPSPCRACHPDALAAYACYGCHEHDPAEVQEEHAEEGLGDIANCVECHPTGQEDEGRED
jgi:hypothetical protein